MSNHDSRCEGADDQKVLDDVAKYGWHVVKILDTPSTPGWAFSIGLFQNFEHPEIIVFGLDLDLMHSIINIIGEETRSGKRFEVDWPYADLIETYSCVFKPVSPVWYGPFLGYAEWFYKGPNFPAIQCIWPDRNSLYPWDEAFNPHWRWAQPLLFHSDPDSARAIELLKSLDLNSIS